MVAFALCLYELHINYDSFALTIILWARKSSLSCWNLEYSDTDDISSHQVDVERMACHETKMTTYV